MQWAYVQCTAHTFEVVLEISQTEWMHFGKIVESIYFGSEKTHIHTHSLWRSVLNAIDTWDWYDKMTSKWEICITSLSATHGEIFIFSLTRRIQMIRFRFMKLLIVLFFFFALLFGLRYLNFFNLVFNFIIFCSFDFMLWAWETNQKVKGEFSFL